VSPEQAAGLFADVQTTSHGQFVPAREELRCDEDVLRGFAEMGAGRRLLDVGSGDGRFLAAARARGFDCVGTDVSEKLAGVARHRAGVPVLVGQLAELDLPDGSFDWINLDQVLSYIPHAREVMGKVAGLLRPGGICRVRENDPDSLSARCRGKGYWMYAPTHVNVWSGKSIAALARAVGLRLARVIAGTESSLANWLATAGRRGVRQGVRDTLLYLLRRTRVFNVSVAADTVYYLRKPLPAQAPEPERAGSGRDGR
jgi:SAM-dependent methyltransferase